MSAIAEISDSLRARLEGQLGGLPFVLADAGEETLRRRPPSGKWSALENLAHVARHHEVFRERLRRILDEDRPELRRYRAEEDPEWPAWAASPTGEVLARLTAFRAEIIRIVRSLSPEQLARVGVHPTFGPMTVPEWLEFFLLHEAHHLYLIAGLARN